MTLVTSNSSMILIFLIIVVFFIFNMHVTAVCANETLLVF